MEIIMENIYYIIAIIIFIICLIIGYFADKKLKLDEIVDKKMNTLEKKDNEENNNNVSNEPEIIKNDAQLLSQKELIEEEINNIF